MKRNYENHGSTIGGAIILGLLAMCAVGLARAATSSAKSVAIDPPQIVIGQPQVTETLTCAYTFAHYDARQYGTIEGTGCTLTGPINLANAHSGNVMLDATMTDGTHIVLKGCAVQASVFGQSADGSGFISADLNCF
jgi:hypothetical protein